ncbi:MAG: hypothetical protein F8N36_13780 [Desulfovibrio sp.]|uniref:hypothetical protein n=1 Tax=Desulfovibrio sp. TaxID=885 RepID=UPI00135E68AD|nr:hypothetical protein [Desulfovibrio sp.]MTJ93908.1 hypothetical protein [Desulfovibrio sp.]
MGDVLRKFHVAAGSDIDIELVASAVQQVVGAVTDFHGADCLLYAKLGAALLRFLGVQAEAVAGSAAWRVGAGDGDVISHALEVAGQGFVPHNSMGLAAMFHAWIEGPGFLIDFSTCTLKAKAQALDNADGGRTNVEWAPNYLSIDPDNAPALLDRAMAVVQAAEGGVYFYRRHAQIERVAFAESGDTLIRTLLFAARSAYAAAKRGENIRIVGLVSDGEHQEMPKHGRFVPMASPGHGSAVE